MKFNSVKPPKIRLKEKAYSPVEIPEISHESRAGWKNHGIEIYNERFGKDAFSTVKDLPIPMPSPGLLDGFALNNLIRLVRTLFGLGAYFKGQRGTHAFGVGAKGKLKVLDNPDFPANEFFEPGKEFDIRFRHSNAAFVDDACSQVRGTAIKFADTSFESPFDLLMNTGSIHPFWNMDSLWKFMKARIKADDEKASWDSQKAWLEASPTAYMTAIDSMRNAPASYAEVVTHSLMPHAILGKDGVTRYIKFRVMPKGLKKESGLLSQERQKTPWNQSRDKDNTMPVSYLADEYRERFKKGPIEYFLQAQVRQFDEEKDSDEFFNCARYWKESDYPWLDIAEFKATEILEDDVMEPMRMFLGNTPPSISIIKSTSKYDYNSLNWARALVYNHSWRQRKRKNKY